MERIPKWLDVLLVVLRLALVAVSALAADQALIDGQLSDALRPVAAQLGGPLLDRQK